MKTEKINSSQTALSEEQRQPFPMEGTPDGTSGGFEILCITAGTGNGWEFSPEVLREAVPLFDGVQCFIDHLPLDSEDGHSVRDVAGLISEPVFDETAQGIRAKLTPFGPSADLLRETCQEVLAQEGTDTRDSAVVQSGRAAADFVGVLDHGAEFKDSEITSYVTTAFRAIEHREARIDDNRQCDNQIDGPQQGEQQNGQQEIQKSFEDMIVEAIASAFQLPWIELDILQFKLLPNMGRKFRHYFN